jgi:hypothetical protein
MDVVLQLHNVYALVQETLCDPEDLSIYVSPPEHTIIYFRI